MSLLLAKLGLKHLIWVDTSLVSHFDTQIYRYCNCKHFFVARKLWKEYFASGVDGVVYLVDAVDRARFPEAKKELDVRHVYNCIFSSLSYLMFIFIFRHC